MPVKWNWKQITYGSGALVAAFSAVFALTPSDKPKDGKARDFENSSCTKVAKFPSLHMPGATDKEKLLDDAIKRSRKLCKRVKDEMGLPGLTVGVSVNGKMVWQEGFGFSNIENQVRMKPEGIMRIASISKSLTMAMLAKLMEDGKIDIDKPIQTYLPTYPEKCVDGEKVTLTTRHLLSHLSGIRHYKKKELKTKNDEDPQDTNVDKSTSSIFQKKKDTKPDEPVEKTKKKKRKSVDDDEMELSEYFLKEKFASVEDAMKLFKDDELFHKPGTKYMYTTHGWTVVSAIIEKLTDTEFPKYARRMFDYWGLKNTYLDLHEPIIYNRVNYYTRKKDGEIQNAPYVDNSYKWAGGGFLSNVADLNQFANILLYSMQTPEGSYVRTCEKGLPKIPFLKQSTMKKIWTGDPATARPEVPDLLYALGFVVGEPIRKCMFCKERDLMTVSHSGGAIGASSILLMAFPPGRSNCDNSSKSGDVEGVVVAMITNLTSIGLSKAAQEIANNFRELM